MSSFSSLELGKRALLAQRFGLDVTSNNIANVNTEGYSRRTAVLSQTAPENVNGNYVGTGVSSGSLRTFREEYIDKEIRNTTSREATYEKDTQIYDRLEAILAEPTEKGIGSTVTEFFDSFDEVALNPEDVGLRDNLLGEAKALAESFNTMSSDMSDLREEISTNINTEVNSANKLIEEIAALNKSIASSKTADTNAAQSLVDERELKFEQLAKIVDIAVTTESDSSANVFINGMNIITGGDYNEIKCIETTNSATGERTIQAQVYVPSKELSYNLNVGNGSLASDLKHFNVTLDNKDSSGGFSVFKSLDEYANAIATKVNNLTVTGYGLDDKAGSAPGRTFFSTDNGVISAANIELSDDVKDKPRDIPLSSAAGEPGNSKIAQALGRLNQDSEFINGQSQSEFYSLYIGKIGTFAKEAETGLNTTQLVAEQLDTQRESVIGVNSDEEAINLIKYQRAFQAASQIINITSELLNTVVNLGR